MQNIEKIREQFPITRYKVFLNHAAMSPPPKPVADAIRRCTDDVSNFGETSIEWTDFGKPIFAKLIGAKQKEIALVENTSTGLNIDEAKEIAQILSRKSIVVSARANGIRVSLHFCSTEEEIDKLTAEIRKESER